MNTPIHQQLSDLVAWSVEFAKNSPSRRYWVQKVAPLYSDPENLATILGASKEWSCALEIAASGLFAAEAEGDLVAQEIFLKAIRRLAPLTSKQRDYAVSRLSVLSSDARR